MSCNYTLRTKYENLKREAFSLLKKDIFPQLKNIYEYSIIGEEKTELSQELANYYYLIEYLLSVRISIDNYIECNGCVSKEYLDSILNDYYSILCIKKNKVCNRYTNNLIDLFISGIPYCESVFNYVWDGTPTCDGKDLRRDYLYTQYNGNNISNIFVPVDAEINYYVSVLGLTLELATELYNSRYINNYSTCCSLEEPFSPTLNIVEVTNNTIEIEWDSVGERYQINVSYNDSYFEFYTEDTSLLIEDLPIKTEVIIEVIAINCAGSSSTTTLVQTTPYSVEIVFCEDLVGNVDLTDAILGLNVVENYGDTFSFSFNSTGTLYEITDVTLNDASYIDDVIWTNTFYTANIGGKINVFNVTSNVVLYMCGNILDYCSLYSLTYDDNLEILTIE